MRPVHPIFTGALGLLAAWAALAAPAGAQGGGKAVELAPKVVFEVVELRRLADKGAMQLKFTISNGTATPVTARNLGLATSYRLEGIDIIDFANKRSFTIGSASRCLCTTFDDGGSVAPGQKREFWAWYGLPTQGVQALSIQVASVPPIMDVPLQ